MSFWENLKASFREDDQLHADEQEALVEYLRAKFPKLSIIPKHEGMTPVHLGRIMEEQPQKESLHDRLGDALHKVEGVFGHKEAAIQETIMATAPVTPAPKKQSFLQHLGSVLRNILHIGEEAAVVATPIVTMAFPEIAPLYTSALGLAISAEGTLGTATGTGVQKLQSIAPQIIALGQKFAADNGFTWVEKEITEWASAVVDTVNRIPAPVKTVA